MGINNKSKALALKRLERRCEKWNDAADVGATVVVKLDGYDHPMITTTRTPATILSGHSAVIWLNGVSGCYQLDRVRAAANIAECYAAMAELYALYVAEDVLFRTYLSPTDHPQYLWDTVDTPEHKR